MASVTFKIIQNETVRDDGTQLVMVRVTYQRRHKYVGTGVYVREKQFNPDGTYDKENWIRKNHDQALLLNGSVKAWLDKGASVVRRLNQIERTFTVDEVKRRMEQSESATLSDHIRHYIARLDARNKRGSANVHRYLLRAFLRFLGRDALTGQFTLQELTPEVMDQYETFLLMRPPMKKSSTESSRRNTANEYLRKLHQHMRTYLIKHKLPDELDPLRGRVFKEAPTERVTFNEAEFLVWKNLKLPTTTKGERTRNHARNIYLISYYLHGLRAMDLILAKVSQVQSVWQMKGKKIVQEYRFYTVAEKTNKTKSVLIEETILPLMKSYMEGKQPDDYLFPFMPASTRHLSEDVLKEKVNSRTKHIDRLLKDVAKIAEINKKVSLHSARHSFADDLYEHSGDIRLVSMSLSHSEVQTTERYLKRRSQSVIDRANDVYRRGGPVEESEQQSEEPTPGVLKQY